MTGWGGGLWPPCSPQIMVERRSARALANGLSMDSSRMVEIPFQGMAGAWGGGHRHLGTGCVQPVHAGGLGAAQWQYHGAAGAMWVGAQGGQGGSRLHAGWLWGCWVQLGQGGCSGRAL